VGDRVERRTDEQERRRSNSMTEPYRPSLSLPVDFFLERLIHSLARASPSDYPTAAMDNSVDLSRATRTSVMLSAELFRDGRQGSSAHRVTNIPETGLCIAQPGDLAAGSVVVVTIGRVEQVPADVIWVRTGLAGLKFQTPIDIAEARARRPAGYKSVAPSAGWLTALNDPYAK
jgi:hypothetical protein